MAAALSLREREEIAVGLVGGESQTAIAARLGRHRSTISREIGRNTAFDYLGMPYRAVTAHREALHRLPRPKPAKLADRGSPLRTLVLDKLAQRWSPEQISGWLAVEYPDQAAWQVSHETIYQAIYLQARGGLRVELAHQQALRSGRVRRRAQPAAGGAVRSQRPWLDLRLADRPAEVADRVLPGHWEGDLLIGVRQTSAIATLVERASRFLALVALPQGRVSEHVIAELTAKMATLPAAVRRTLTWDQGSEMARHAEFSLATGCEVYFCDPHSPWQRGSNENTNGLLRQYFPKGQADFRRYTQHDLDTVADQLNTRPRKTLGWKTPTQRLNELLVASTT